MTIPPLIPSKIEYPRPPYPSKILLKKVIQVLYKWVWKRLMSGMENLITGGGRRKFVGVLNSIHKSFAEGEY
jgi:hypothetical protein